MKKNNVITILIIAFAVIIMSFVCLFVGSSGMSIKESFFALLGKGSAASVRIIRNIRLPRVLAAIIAGAGLSLSGLIMQTVLSNTMASPSTLGVTNAAVFGANLSIIVFSGGLSEMAEQIAFLSLNEGMFSSGVFAFVFAVISVILILSLCSVRSFSPSVVVLSGIAIGSVWTAATTVLQFYATDVGLSSAIIWNFGDLGRASYKSDAVMLIVLLVCIFFFVWNIWKYNALLSGDAFAISLGINLARLRFLSLLFASAMTAVCVSFLGIIGFVGIICPHISKKILSQDHSFSIPLSLLTGSLLLLVADTFSRTVGGGSAIPVGAITSLLGAPFFIALIIGKRVRRDA